MAVPRIVVVDDNEILQVVIHRLLLREGYDVTPWQIGSDVIGFIREAAPDVAVLDLELGRQSGAEIVEQLRSDPATARIGVIAYSGNPFVLDNTSARLNELGCTLLDKPLKLDDMVNAVRDMLKRIEHT